MITQDWSRFAWRNPPPRAEVRDDRLLVTTAPDTDYWRTTSYGFIHDNGHFFGMPLGGDAGVELAFTGAFDAQFDQAGLMLWASPETWLKTGIEMTDGTAYASVVVTNGLSDWSVAPLPLVDPATRVTIRASIADGAVTVRYGLGAEPRLELLRLTYLPRELPLRVGPFCCSPIGPGLAVSFEPLRIGEPDLLLHAE